MTTRDSGHTDTPLPTGNARQLMARATAALSLFGVWVSGVPAEEQVRALEEVVVTATKRAESAQEIPVTVTVLTGDDLTDLRLKDGFDVVTQTPNMFVDTAAGTRVTPRFNIRGVGTNDFSPIAATSVGVIFDEVFINNNLAQSTPLYDLERVEVLRGPQGTLWGKNTTAGTVNFVSRKPTFDSNGYGRVTYGDYDLREFEGAVGGTLVDNTLAGRIAFFTSARDGLYQNSLLNTDVGNFDDFAARGQLLWAPTEDLEMRLILYTRSLSETMVFHVQGLNPDGSNFNGYREDPDAQAVATNINMPLNFDSTGATVLANWTSPNGVTLSSVTGYVDVSQDRRADGDATPATVQMNLIDIDVNQFSQELRLTSPTEQRLRWLAGVYYLDDDVSADVSTDLPLAPANDSLRSTEQQTESWAMFGSLELDFTDRLTTRLGVRYTEEDKNIDLLTIGYTPGAGSDPLNPFAGTFGAVRADVVDEDSTNKVTWDASLEYRLAEGKMLYARVAEGFKATQYNGNVFTPADVSVAAPETILDYELGGKTSWLNNRLEFNVATFYYDYSDYQINTVSTTSAGIATSFSNAESASVRGVEAELKALPVQNLLLRLTLGWNDSEFDSFPNAIAVTQANQGQPFDASGQRLTRSPDSTGSALLQYTAPLATGDLLLQTDWYYVGETNYDIWVDASNLNPVPAFGPFMPAMRASLKEEDYTVGNLRVAYLWGERRNIELSFWMRNVTDEFYRTNRYQFFGIGEAVYFRGEPRTYGATFSYTFGGR